MIEDFFTWVVMPAFIGFQAGVIIYVIGSFYFGG